GPKEAPSNPPPKAQGWLRPKPAWIQQFASSSIWC
ncbi:unnamed protein product, partial [Ectocarpus sp. 4 AP-2014]